ncbi:MAG: cytochrome P450 [Chloroflexia bacterium]
MTAAVASEVKPFEALPLVQLPETFESDLPQWTARMAAELGPIFRVRYSGDHVPVYMVGPEANRFVLFNGREHFSHEAGWTPIIGTILGRGILNMDGAEHNRDRKTMNPAFTIAYMARYLPAMVSVIRARTADWAARGEVDLFEETRRITFDVAAEALIGLDRGEEVDLLRRDFMALIYGNFDPPPTTHEEYLAAIGPIRKELDDLLLSRIAERRARPTDDVLGLLVQARDEAGQPLSDQQLLGHVNILLVAGHETSTTMSSWLLYLLASHPEYLARVRAELDELLGPDPDAPITLDAVKGMRVLGNALTEAGRLYAPVVNGPRGVAKAFDFGGYHVPAGEQVRYSIAAGHLLPSVFADPERFDPDRFAAPREEDKKTPYGLVTFGGGPRICIGVNFAQVEIKALAAHVLRRFDLEVVPGQQIRQIYAPTIGAPTDGIRMRVTGR